MVDPASGLAAAARFHEDLIGWHEGRTMDPSARRARDRDKGIGGRGEPDRPSGTDQDHGGWWPIEDRLTRADDAEVQRIRSDGGVTLEHQHEPLAIVGDPGDHLPGLESVDGKVRVVPAGGCRIDRDDEAVRPWRARTAEEPRDGRWARPADVWLDPGVTWARIPGDLVHGRRVPCNRLPKPSVFG